MATRFKHGRRVSAWMCIAVLAGGVSSLSAPLAAAAEIDEIHYTYTGPTSVAFNWRGAAQDIRFGLTSDYGGGTVQGQQPSPLPFSSTGPFWEAHLTGLTAGTAYHYSVGGGPDQVFSTAPVGNFRFVATGDVGASTRYSAVTPTQNQIAASNPDFVLALGDLTYGSPNGQTHVDQHFNDVMAWSRTAAYMPAWGNHEWENATLDDLRNYKGRFAFPNPQTSPGAPAAGCCGEDWSWFDAGGVRFVTYPEPWTGARTDWKTKVGPIMAAAQADSSIHFIVTAGHRAAYSTGNHAGSTSLAGILDGFGDKYSKYLLNLNAHSHNYERFTPIHGVTHITASGGGSSLQPPWKTTDPRTAYRAMHMEHVRVDVTASSMRIEAVCGPATSQDDIICTQGSVIDSVTILAPGATEPGNSAPRVDAGTDQAVVLPDAASLNGSVTDDGLPNPPGSVTTAWSQVSGPGTATFAAPTSKATTATFSAAGTYIFRLTASDSQLSGSDDIVVTAQPEGTPRPIDVPVAAGSDDAEERGSSVSLTSSDLELVTDGSTAQIIGVRFPGVAVPRGATISNAYIQFRADEVSTDAASLTVSGQAADNAATFTTASRNVSTRPRISTTVSWTPPAWNTVNAVGPEQRTPNLAQIAQEVVNRAGWASGNAMAFIITGTGRRTADAIEDGWAPVLHIEYST